MGSSHAWCLLRLYRSSNEFFLRTEGRRHDISHVKPETSPRAKTNNNINPLVFTKNRALARATVHNDFHSCVITDENGPSIPLMRSTRDNAGCKGLPPSFSYIFKVHYSMCYRFQGSLPYIIYCRANLSGTRAPRDRNVCYFVVCLYLTYGLWASSCYQ